MYNLAINRVYFMYTSYHVNKKKYYLNNIHDLVKETVRGPAASII